MSLLDQGPDEVLVYVEEDGTDGDGNPVKVPSAYPIQVRGRVQFLSATETDASGVIIGTTYRLICRSFPAGAFAHVEWQGRRWDVQGEPVRRHGSDALAHVAVVLRARRPEVRYG